jgi:cardiolipin synthase
MQDRRRTNTDEPAPAQPASRVMRAARFLFGRNGWRDGHEVLLLENGEQYFPAVFDAIRAARSEVLIETFILFEDKVGQELRQLLVQAEQRGVAVDLLVDGFGSAELGRDYTLELTEAGVRPGR